MKFFEIISAGVIVAAESLPVPADRAQFFGSITKIETNVEIPQIEQCCTSLKVIFKGIHKTTIYKVFVKLYENVRVFEVRQKN